MPRRSALLLALAVGLLAGLVCFTYHTRAADGAGDLSWPLRGARLLLAGRNPYHDTLLGVRRAYPQNDVLLYPLPACLLLLPLAGLPDPLAAGLFVGVSAGLLAYGFARRRREGLSVLLSAPFWCAAVVSQWSLLLTAAAVLPWLLPLTSCKPTIGLAAWAAQEDRRSILAWGALAALPVLISLAVLPTWPLDWLANLGHARYPRVIAVFTWGGWLALAVVARLYDPRARSLLALAVTPNIPLFYDYTGLWLVPRTARQSLGLSMLSWAAYLVYVLTWRVNLVTSILFAACAGLLLLEQRQGAANWTKFRYPFDSKPPLSQEGRRR